MSKGHKLPSIDRSIQRAVSAPRRFAASRLQKTSNREILFTERVLRRVSMHAYTPLVARK
jgi:hypothetical protein